jgi:chloramphenicol 3-O phosphotransferase
MAEKTQIIFIHGASSSGKSTLARALQQRIEVSFWHISIDHLRDSGVLPMERFHQGEFNWSDARSAFFDGFHASLGAYAEAGNNLIVEHILYTPGWQTMLARLFHPFDVLFVGLHCPLELLREREQARGDRPAGSAEQDFLTIHRGRAYDLDLEATDALEANLDRLLRAWRRPRTSSTFFQARF